MSNKLISFLLVFFFCTSAFASKTALIYHSNYADAHTNVKAQLEADGYTVTLSTTGTVDENLISSYDVVWDMKYNNSIGSNGKTRYQNFVNAGGVLVLVGENNASYSNNNQTIEAFIENKLGGTVGLSGNTDGCAYNCTNNNNSNTITTTNTDVTDSNYGNDVAVYPFGTHFTGDGTWVAKNGNSQIVWMRWSGSQLPSGYTGAAYITFDINQFESSFDKAKMANLISDTYENFLTVTNITPTSTQTTTVNNAKAITGNGVKLNVDGDSNTINIEQSGENNFLLGTDWSSDATITGNNNTLNVDQGNVTTSGNSGNNGIGLDITGNTNTVSISQGDYATDTGDHRIWLDIDGSTNTTNLSQRNDGTATTEHFMSLDLNSSSNIINLQQLNDGDKILFVDINNSNNTVDINQSGTGEHYLDLSLDTGSYAHDVDISQTGSGDHAARVELDGYSVDFNLLQQGSVDQDYNVDMTCGVIAGCTLSTTQGN
jgi:hypothetical protein